MNNALLSLIAGLFLVSFSQVFAQSTPTELQSENAVQSVANQNLPQQIIPFRFNISESRRERLFWTEIKNRNNADDFRLFLEQFPKSTFAGMAASKLKDLDEKSKLAVPNLENSTSEKPSGKLEDNKVFQKPRMKLENTKAARENLYKEYFLANYKGSDDQRHIAYESAQDYLYNFASDDDEIVKYLKHWIDKYSSICKCVDINIQKFNKAYSEGNFAKTFAAGKNILSKQPDYLVVMLFMVDIGFFETYIKRDNKLNDETIFYAREAIKRIEAGKIPEVDNYWVPFKNKDDALAWLNYEVAFIYHFRKEDTNSAAPYFYQATKYQYKAAKAPWMEFSPSHIPYTVLGEWYLDRYNQTVAEYTALDNNPKNAEAIKDNLTKKLQLLADLALASYAHAYIKAEKLGVKHQYVVEKIKPVLTELYRLRQSADLSQLDAFAATLSEKPITDPATIINP